MSQQEILLEKIRQQLETAEYILERTYPLVKEEKLFVEVLGYLFAATSDLVSYSAIDLENKGIISEIPTNSYDRLRILTPHIKTLPQDLSALYKELHTLTQNYKSDLISFKRHQTYVICTKDYKVEVLSQYSLRNFVKKVENIYMYHTTARKNRGMP